MAMPSEPLPEDFYARPVLEVARDLVGCVVEARSAVSGPPTEAGRHSPSARIPDSASIPVSTSGVIVETEAYHDSEPACHAFVGLTPRTRTLFGPPGRAYVYRSYGIHALLNAVCEPEGIGAAVLIRALQPLEGIEAMRARRSRAGIGIGIGETTPMRDDELCSGPGKLTQALGIELSENGGDLSCGPVLIRPRTAAWLEPDVVASTRIGITKAIELPWRLSAAGNRHVSRPRPLVPA
jgi:DNA-3-methyladenine glycosylase